LECFRRGAVVGVLSTFPLAGVCALFFRFPVPFDGYRSGVDAVVPALLATLFYGVLGGFVIQALLGGLGGVAASKLASGSPTQSRRLCVVGSLAGASVGVIALALLDRFIGPWEVDRDFWRWGRPIIVWCWHAGAGRRGRRDFARRARPPSAAAPF